MWRLHAMHELGMTINLLMEINEYLIYYLDSWIHYFMCIAGGRDDAKLSIPATVILRNMFSPAEMVVIYNDHLVQEFTGLWSVALVPPISFISKCFSIWCSDSQGSIFIWKSCWSTHNSTLALECYWAFGMMYWLGMGWNMYTYCHHMEQILKLLYSNK